MSNLEVRRVLAPTDLSDSDATPLRYASLLSERLGASLTVMYADPILYPGERIPSDPHDEERLRQQIEQRLCEWVLGKKHETLVIPGQPVASILHAAGERNADLIVMGTHARRGFHRALLGSVAEGVLHGSECPVVTVSQRLRPHEGAVSISKMICPVNFSDTAYASLRWASRMASTFGTELVVVHVIEPDAPPSETDLRRVREWIEPELGSAVSYRELVLHGGAAERVLDCAEDISADFLVIGAQHKLFRDTTVIGTTTERLVRFASCPVMVVPRQLVAPVTQFNAAASAASRR
jgi:nucleotide-binding universal stress UspA family protein